MLFLAVDERQELVRIIESLSTFTIGGPRGRLNVIQQAGLHRFLPGIDLTGAPREVAGDLVSRLENYGDLAEQPGYHALGALLSYVLTLGDLPPEKASFLASLIVRYSLVRDPKYIVELRDMYHIADRVVRQPPASQIMPLLTMPDQAEVPFSPDQTGLEQVINSEGNFLDVDLLAGAIYCAQAVCRLETLDHRILGTGFLIGPDLLLSNQHVLERQADLSHTIAHFGCKNDSNRVEQPGRVVKLQTDFYYASESAKLDYALVRLQEQPLKHIALNGEGDGWSYLEMLQKGKHRGYLNLAAGHTFRAQDRVNIIQHPGGQPMKVVLTQNYVVAATNAQSTRVQYVADTMNGSSGSPVFNQNWEVVALHHSGKPYPPDSPRDALKKVWDRHFRVNEGIPMQVILEDFHENGIDKKIKQLQFF
jgi:V8-like Glu-specific endopeptidase